MPKIRIPDEDLNIDELEDADYETRERFATYDGPQPPKGTILRGVVQKIWWTISQKGDSMLTLIWVADGNEGKLEQYEGLTIWDYIVLLPQVKFRWKPFVDVMGTN